MYSNKHGIVMQKVNGRPLKEIEHLDSRIRIGIVFLFFRYLNANLYANTTIQDYDGMIFHNDFHGGNIMIDGTDDVISLYLIDFGNAILIKKDSDDFKNMLVYISKICKGEYMSQKDIESMSPALIKVEQGLSKAIRFCADVVGDNNLRKLATFLRECLSFVSNMNLLGIPHDQLKSRLDGILRNKNHLSFSDQIFMLATMDELLENREMQQICCIYNDDPLKLIGDNRVLLRLKVRIGRLL
jgi:hypothetical protein